MKTRHALTLAALGLAFGPASRADGCHDRNAGSGPRARRSPGRGQHHGRPRLPDPPRSEGPQERSRLLAPTPPDAALEALVAHQTALLAESPAAVKAWAAGEPSTFDPAKDLTPLLSAGLPMPETCPSTSTRRISPRPRRAARGPTSARSPTSTRPCSRSSATAIACRSSSPSTSAWVCPSTSASSAFPAATSDFLAVGRQLEGKSCASPVGLTAAEWQIAGRKIWNWGEKNQHIRDAQVLAKELLGGARRGGPRPEDEGAARAEGRGHRPLLHDGPSLVVAVGLRAHRHRDVRDREPQGGVPAVPGGGLTSSRAYKNFYEDALAWKPDTVLLVVINRTDEDLADLKTMGEGLRRRREPGSSMFDDVHDPDAVDPARLAEGGGRGARVAASRWSRWARCSRPRPDRPRFFCLDKIHMTEPYHRLMAKEWLKFLVGARAHGNWDGAMEDKALRHQGARWPERPRSRPRRSSRRPSPASGRAHVIAATGASQFEFLDALTAAPGIDWAKTVFFHLDEYVGLPETHPASFRRYLKERIVAKVHPGAFHFIEGDAADPAAEARRVGEILAAHPIDVAFVGIGENGHLAFNDPPADFETEEPYLVVSSTRPAGGSRWARDGSRASPTFPSAPISMSIAADPEVARDPGHRSRRAQGQAVHDCLEREVSPPTRRRSSRHHPRTTVYLDRASARLLRSPEAPA